MPTSMHVTPADEEKSSIEARPHSPPESTDPEKAVNAIPSLPQSITGDDGPAEEEEKKERWNESKINIFRFSTTLFCFVIMGMNDAATGALIPYIGPYYDISYTVISLLFLSPFVGYLLAAMLNSLIHHQLGRRGVAVIAPLCRLLGYVALSVHPPYPALPVVQLFPGFGNGLEDSAWNSWVGNMASANELLGLLHGAYGLGATISPLIATAMITKAGRAWYEFYYVMAALSVAELACTTAAFWGATAAAYRATPAGGAGAGADGGHRRTTTRTVLREPVTWLVSLFLLGYVGAEVSLGGWVVEFMLRVRRAGAFEAGLTVVFFWLGITVGRVVLGFVTGRIGEKLAITGYMLLSIALQLLYWLVPSFAASAVFVALLGFFLGPLFPAAVVAATKLLPSTHHVSAIGFAAAFGGGGAAILPFAVGAIAQVRGVEVLQPIVLAIFVFILLMWFLLPGGMRRGGLEYARDHKQKPGHEVMNAVRWVKAKMSRSR